MKTVKVKANGKLNLGLNVTGREGEYHSLDTVMCAINIADAVTVTTSKKKEITLKSTGYDLSDVSSSDNVVYKAARAFCEEFGTAGGSVLLKKIIPAGGGLGGSSSDIVATVKAFQKAYGVEDDVLPLIKKLCSDGEFLYENGVAHVTGRGSVQNRIFLKQPRFFVIAVPEEKCVTAEVFKEFDRGDYPSVGCDVENVFSSVSRGENPASRELFNALYLPAKTLNKSVGDAYEHMRSLSPDFFGMTGSGSSVYGCFSSVELCLWAQDKLRRTAKEVFVRESI